MKKLIACLMLAAGVSIYAEDIKIKAGDKIFFRENESWYRVRKITENNEEVCEIITTDSGRELLKKGDAIKIKIGYPGERELYDGVMAVKTFDEESITFYVDTKDLPEIYYIYGYHNNWVKNPYKWDE